MSDLKFYIILNLLDILLTTYVFGMMFLWYYALLMYDENLLVIIIPILIIILKFCMLLITFKITEKIFPNSSLTKFANELKSNHKKRKSAIILALIYDLFAMILLIFLSHVITAPLAWIMFSVGGVWSFYSIIFIQWDTPPYIE